MHARDISKIRLELEDGAHFRPEECGDFRVTALLPFSMPLVSLSCLGNFVRGYDPVARSKKHGLEVGRGG